MWIRQIFLPSKFPCVRYQSRESAGREKALDRYNTGLLTRLLLFSNQAYFVDLYKGAFISRFIQGHALATAAKIKTASMDSIATGFYICCYSAWRKILFMCVIDSTYSDMYYGI